MKIIAFEYKLCSNSLCTTCSRNFLRERAQSERLQILSERLRRVRGLRVRCSLIPNYPIPHSITIHIPISLPPTHPHPQQCLSSERTIHNTFVFIASSSSSCSRGMQRHHVHCSSTIPGSTARATLFHTFHIIPFPT